MENRSERRGFLIAAISALAAAPMPTGLFSALRAILAPAGGTEPSRRALCKLSEVPEAGILERTISYHQRRGPAVETISRHLFLTRDQGQVIALSNRCTHLGCAVNYDQDASEAPLICPCHGGKFSPLGAVVHGPPVKPLERLQLELPEDPEGTVYLVE